MGCTFIQYCNVYIQYYCNTVQTVQTVRTYNGKHMAPFSELILAFFFNVFTVFL